MKITCLINEGPTPWPLIYTVDVPSLDYRDIYDASPDFDKAVTEAIIDQRRGDIGLDDDEPLEIELLMAFVGDPKLARDWRE